MRARGKRSASAVTVSISCRAGKHAALELEIVKAVSCLGCLGQAQHSLRGQRLFMAQPQPRVGSV